MTAPTRKLRLQVYDRDHRRCLDCGRTDLLTFQHREASGSGGRGKKAPPLTSADGITLCTFCNDACETTAGQSRALALGYKIRRNRGVMTADRIPVYDRNDKFWYLLDDDGGRNGCLETLAAELLFAAGNLTRTMEGAGTNAEG